jgi:pimeloyl-ACP methyl ester carboxylesterase
VAHNTWTDGFADETVIGADGAPLRVFVRAGRPGIFPVVLLHGIAQTRHFWGPVVRHLPADWPLAIVDQRGHGDSDVPITESVSFRQLGRDVGAVLEALDYNDTIVVGHSWGGAVAATTGAMFPDRTASVVAIDGGLVALQDLGDRDEVRRRLTPPDRGFTAARLPALFARSPLGPWLTDDVTEALLGAYRVDDDGKAYNRLGFSRHMFLLDGMLEEHPEDYLEHITVPTWVVIAEPMPTTLYPDEADTWAHSRQAAVERAILMLKHPRVVRLTGALHDVPLQYPNLVAGVIASAHNEAELAAAGHKGAVTA